MLKVLLDLFWRHIISWNDIAKIMIIILVCKSNFETNLKQKVDWEILSLAMKLICLLLDVLV